MIENKLKSLMQDRKISVNKLAEEIGMSRQALTALANNQSKGIQFDTLEKLLSYFQVPIQDFFEVYGEGVTLEYISDFSYRELKTLETMIEAGRVSIGYPIKAPSVEIPFSCKLYGETGEGISFKITISPIVDNAKILAVRLNVFKENDGDAITPPPPQVKSFFDRLDIEKRIDFISELASEWLRLYYQIKTPIFQNEIILVVTFLNKDNDSFSIPATMVTTDTTYKFKFKLTNLDIELGDKEFSKNVTIKKGT